MFKRTLTFLLLAGSASLVFSQEISQKSDELLEAFAGLNKFNGTVLIYQNDNILLEKGYGFKDVESKTLNNSNTIFQIGSITKQFTAMVILKLLERNQLSLSDKLSKYYPDFPKGDSITLEHLLTHTSGIFNYTDDASFMSTEVTKPANEQKILALFKDKDLQFSPGSNWAYSNSGYSLLGYIIEKVTETPYEEVVRKFIFAPLEMKNSGFDFAGLVHKEKATGYNNPEQKSIVVDSSVSYAGGAIYSTVWDLLKWHNALQTNKLIANTLLEKAYTPYMNNYGYGVTIDSVFNKRRIAHGGGIFGFTSYITRVPEDNVCIVVLNNINNRHLADISNRLLAIIYGKAYEIPAPRQEIELGTDILQRYIGIYEVRPDFSITVTLEDGRLIAQPSGQRKSPLFAMTENRFFLKDVEVEVEFLSDKTTGIDKLVFYQNGKATAGKKIK
ncbi:serine hydrolase [Fulvivirgaceae bacterium BMA12]|uniref:Serine hydrolase n=1 Tax=Agaribacillus aureus TaxID=3051825 RepID=A0ABT8LFN2_9BACT|nr:serine hydrolase [Fulvivirgaceae bacterium BMA12]